MKAVKLLYSRTYSRDYRWIFEAAELPREQAKPLLDVFEIYSASLLESVANREVPVLLCQIVNDVVALCRVRIVGDVDYQGRRIRALEGLCFPIRCYDRIPDLVENHSLDIYRSNLTMDLDDAKSLQEGLSIDIGSDSSRKASAESESLQPHLEIEFNQRGMQELMSVVLASGRPQSFLFGAPDDCRSRLASTFDLIVPMNGSLSLANRRSQRNSFSKNEISDRPSRTEVLDRAHAKLVQIAGRVGAKVEALRGPIAWSGRIDEGYGLDLAIDNVHRKLKISGWAPVFQKRNPRIGDSYSPPSDIATSGPIEFSRLHLYITSSTWFMSRTAKLRFHLSGLLDEIDFGQSTFPEVHVPSSLANDVIEQVDEAYLPSSVRRAAYEMQKELKVLGFEAVGRYGPRWWNIEYGRDLL